MWYNKMNNFIERSISMGLFKSYSEKQVKKLIPIVDKIEALAHEEIANANDTIAAVECDSRLGWEPSMEYVCDKWHLEWKIRQVNYAVSEIQAYRKMLFLHKQA